MSKSSSWSTVGQGRRGQRVEVKIRPHRSPWVQGLLVVWRWRVEITAGLLLWSHLSWTGDHGVPPWAALAAVLAPVGAALLVPALRRRIAAYLWVQVTRHRLRTYFSEAGITTRTGKLPWLIWVRSTPVGERVTVWLVTGLAVTDLERCTEGIAAACYARDARVTRTRRLATVVVVDVMRRDPLGADRAITNPLTAHTRTAHPRTAFASTALAGTARPSVAAPPRLVALPGGATRALDIRHRVTDELPRLPAPAPAVEPAAAAPSEPAPAKTATAGRRAGPAPTAGPDRPAVIVNGEDVSDYV